MSEVVSLDTPLPLLYRSGGLVAVHKPAGVSVQQEGLLPQLAHQLAVPRLWLVHRLDRVTSGVLLLAEDAAAAAALGQRFAHGRIRKTYWAVAEGKPAKKQGWIKGDMAKARRGAWKLLRSLEQPAVTYFDSRSLGPGLRFYRLNPTTGKTHQLRVALKSLGCPILGDTLYGARAADRVYLHAARTELEWQGQALCIQTPPPPPWPADWQEVEA
ncbi:tRNA pseudouridine32 synthase/23S rRNA pseudouridine746 synthase [Neisseria sp. HSC-16F19]|nr:TIGR01621 family pseudouridine synthase [Neisseria sp. HSC-16F19]MCP2040640.1 tRNA pseudouridine32 synthase/23S rRNA pseudouridine746 synthase [Neisseria sp. HSC-16F19]